MRKKDKYEASFILVPCAILHKVQNHSAALDLVAATPALEMATKITFHRPFVPQVGMAASIERSGEI
jgi:hypothetical protein